MAFGGFWLLPFGGFWIRKLFHRFFYVFLRSWLIFPRKLKDVLRFLLFSNQTKGYLTLFFFGFLGQVKDCQGFVLVFSGCLRQLKDLEGFSLRFSRENQSCLYYPLQFFSSNPSIHPSTFPSLSLWFLQGIDSQSSSIQSVLYINEHSFEIRMASSRNLLVLFCSTERHRGCRCAPPPNPPPESLQFFPSYHHIISIQVSIEISTFFYFSYVFWLFYWHLISLYF